MQKSATPFFKSLIAIGLMAGAATASAGWIRVIDPDVSDIAFNPGGQRSSMAPTNQSPDTVADWLEDLMGLASGALALIDEAADTPGSIDVSLLTTYISVHYGNFGGKNDPLGRVTIAYNCASGCHTFTPETVEGISNYRVYSEERFDKPNPPKGPTESTSAPGVLMLLGAGLASLRLLRRNV